MAMMLGSSRGMIRRRGWKSVPRKLRPLGEQLEPRTLLAAASNPLDTPQFQQGLATAIEGQRAPGGTVASIAFIRDGQLFTEESPGISSDALFRIGSVSKAFAAAAVLDLVQDGKVSLDDSAMSVLGYSPDRRVTGYDPLTLKRVGVRPTPGLFNITVEQLLNMTSGLPNTVTVASQTYPRASPAPPIYNAGSYAALAFAGRPPYHQPATAQQQWNYAVYEISANMNTHPALAHNDSTPNALGPPGKNYDYNDLNYTVLGLIVSELAQQDYGLSYMGYLQTYVLGPMGIAPPMAQPVTNDAMVGLGHTLESQRYPTEVTYKFKNPDQPSIFPDAGRRRAPFYPSKLVPVQYGGGFWLESHYANGGLVATPTAMATFFANLSGSYAGTTAGPLSQQTVATMVAKPPNGVDLPKAKGVVRAGDGGVLAGDRLREQLGQERCPAGQLGDRLPVRRRHGPGDRDQLRRAQGRQVEEKSAPEFHGRGPGPGERSGLRPGLDRRHGRFWPGGPRRYNLRGTDGGEGHRRLRRTGGQRHGDLRRALERAGRVVRRRADDRDRDDRLRRRRDRAGVHRRRHAGVLRGHGQRLQPRAGRLADGLHAGQRAVFLKGTAQQRGGFLLISRQPVPISRPQGSGAVSSSRAVPISTPHWSRQ